MLPNSHRPQFEETAFQELPLLDWDEELEVRYLLSLWDGITTAGRSAATPAAGTRTATWRDCLEATRSG